MYIYRFLNYEGEVIYIGITENIFRRIEQQHFTNIGHLPVECYTSTRIVEFMEYEDLASLEVQIIESLLIEKYNPIYNNNPKQDIGDIRNSKFITLNEDYLIENWNLYKIIDKEETIKNTSRKKLKEEGKGDLLKITKDEVDKIFEVIEIKKDYKAKALIFTLILSDMRISECLQLTLEDIDKDEITVLKHNKVKQIRITRELRDIWYEYLPYRISKGDKLFTSRHGSISRQGCHKIWKKYAKLAGVDSERCYSDNFTNFTLCL